MSVQRRGRHPHLCPHAGARPPRACSWGCPPPIRRPRTLPVTPALLSPAEKKMMSSASAAGTQPIYPQGSPFPAGHSGKAFRCVRGGGPGGRVSELGPVLRHRAVLAVRRLRAGPGRGSGGSGSARALRGLPETGSAVTHMFSDLEGACQGEGIEGASRLGRSRGHLGRWQEVPCTLVPRGHSQTPGREGDSARRAWSLSLRGHSEVQAGCPAFPRLVLST